MPVYCSRAALQPSADQVAALRTARNVARVAFAWTLADHRGVPVGGRLPPVEALVDRFCGILDARMGHITIPVSLLAPAVAGGVREARNALSAHLAGKRRSRPTADGFKGALSVTSADVRGHVVEVAGLGAVRMWEQPRIAGTLISVKIRERDGLWIVYFDYAVSETRKAA